MTMQATATSPKTQVYPLFDVFESEAEFLLVADLPGVTRPNLELAVEQGELRMTAQSEGVEYRRSFKLGDDVDLDRIEAKLELGQLEIHLHKQAASRMRKIEIK